jgi:MSHA biogenesis protein MshN
MDSFKGNISIERQGKPAPAVQRAAVDYRTGLDYMNQGRIDQAIATFNEVLAQDPRHYAARQAQVTLFLERGRTAEAQRSLREGLAVMPETSSWAMLLARLQVEDGDAVAATDTLKKYLEPAQNRGDYQAFLGTVLQMQGRHQEAIEHYEIATKLSPGYGAWLTGLAMSLEEEKRTPEAVDAYKRAYASNTLAPSMRSFVEGKLKQLQ